MKHLKYLLFWLLFLCLGATKGTVQAGSYQALPVISVTHINPIYQGMVDADDLVQPNPYAVAPMVDAYVSEEEAAVQLREQAKNRTETITFYIQTTAEKSSAISGEYIEGDELINELKVLANNLWDAAMVHSIGNPTVGDYIKWQYAGWKCGLGYSVRGTVYYLVYQYTVTYYTTLEQEEVVDAAIAGLFDELQLHDNSKSDYQKIELIYDYICDHVTYDHDNLNDEDYKLKYTAYAALIDKKAVCQGYALLFYRLALECGIDTRLIPGLGHGDAHGWNIVQIDDVYYNLDSTWDAKKTFTEYDYFLKCEDSFAGHSRYDEYQTKEFHASYPMASASYDYIGKHVHIDAEAVVENGTKATCETMGNYESVVYCFVCDAELSREKVENEPATGHTEVIDEAVSATCTSSGLTEGKHCLVCGEVLVEQSPVPKTEHTPKEAVKENELPATCTEKGSYDNVVYCEVCEEEISRILQTTVALGHEEVIDEEVAATCTSTGLTEGKHCSVCGEVLVEQTEVPKNDHTPKEAVKEKETAADCVTDATYESVVYCSECPAEISRETVTLTGSALGHKQKEAVKENELPATCTEEGSYDNVVYCEVCEEEISRIPQTTVALGHKEVIDEEVAATCTSIGLTEGKHCSVCREVLVEQTEVPKNDHTPKEAVKENEKLATCSEKGSYENVVYCEVCEEEISRTPQITAALGHTEVIDEEVAATCTSTGLTEGKHCSVCGEVLIAQEVVPKLPKPETEAQSQAAIVKGASYTVNPDGKTVEYTKLETKASKVTIPATVPVNGKTYQVTKIADKAFAGNTKIKSVTIGKNVKTIGSKAFYNCTKLKTLTMGKKVQAIGPQAFRNCTSLTKVTLPASVKSIGKQAFYNCKKLKTITIKSTKLTTKNVGTKAFGKTYAKAQIKVPKSKVKTYQSLLRKRGISKKAKISK